MATFALSANSNFADATSGSTGPSAADIATAVWANAIRELSASGNSAAAAALAAAVLTPIHAHMKQGNDEQMIGDGSTGNKWRSHFVP